jgi:aminoglycoside phosphotransferase (APT) family kinase protein
VRSLTAHPLDGAQISQLVRYHFGAEVTGVTELSGGTYNVVYGVDLAGGRRTVLKVAPPPGQPLLTYETDLVWAEALYYRRAGEAGLPVPEVLALGLAGEVLPREYVFVSRLPGRLLHEADLPSTVDTEIRRELGRLMAKQHAAPGEWFGYVRRDGHTRADRWSGSFATMVADILADGVRWDVAVPAGIPELVDRHRDLLDEVKTPALVHFDLWDGNVLIEDGRVTGLLDGERCMYADPLAELVSLALRSPIEDVPGLLDGYGLPSLDPAQRKRITLYTIYLYLLMIVEGPSRGYTGPERDASVGWLRGEVVRMMAALD